MNTNTNNIKNKTDKNDVISSLSDENTQLKQYNHELQIMNDCLQEKIRVLTDKLFGRGSEKLTDDQIKQLGLFPDEEVSTQPDEPPEPPITIPEHERNRGGRQKLSEHWPRVDCVHELPEDQRFDPITGVPLVEISREVTLEQLDITPAKIQVIRHIQVKYAAIDPTQPKIVLTPMPPQPIPKSMASPNLLAYIVISKYGYGLPLYRMERMFKQMQELDLSRATMAFWMVKVGQLVQSLVNLCQDALFDYDIMQMDETKVQVLNEPGKTATSQSYMWVQRGGPPDKPVVLYHYDPSRGKQVPDELLAGYQGYLQCDGYSVYDALGQQNASLIVVGCFAHARRKFMDALKAQGKNAKPGKTTEALDMIKQLYKIEKTLREKNASPAQRLEARQTEAKPILEALHNWLIESLPQVPPKSMLGKALGYLYNQWDSLVIYVEDGRLEIDNNLAENAIRPFVIGRKNWLFSQSVEGAEASANLYGLIETAKANGLNVYDYLRHIFKELPIAEASGSVEAIEALLPWNVDLSSLDEGITDE